MDRTLLLFIKALRHAQIPISAADSQAALETVALLGYQNSTQIRHALAITLAKSVTDKHKFHLCFDRFFECSSAEDIDEGSPAPESQQASIDELSQLASLLNSGDQSEMQLQLQLAASEVDTENMISFTQKGQYQRRILQLMGLNELHNDIDALQHSKESADHRLAEQLAEQLSRFREKVSAYVDNQHQLHAAWRGQALQEQQLEKIGLSQVEHTQYALLNTMIRELARKLCKRHSRRQRTYRRGRLDLHATLRHNVAYDGALVDLRWRSQQQKPPRVFALCDVSGSVSRYARFFLLLLHSLQELLPEIRSFVFTSKLTEVSELFEQHPAAQAIDIALKRWAGAGSDYGHALSDLEQTLLDQVDRKSWVFILGDARTNHGNLGLDVMKTLHARCGQLIWLNPEPKALWNTGDSEIARYQTACHQVYGCHSFRELDRAFQALLKQR